MFLASTLSPAMAAPAPVLATETDREAVPHPGAGMHLAQSQRSDGQGPRPLGAVPNSVQVPSLQCLSANDARATLGQLRLKLGQVHLRPSNACPNGGIVAQSPPRGTSVRPNTTIDVIVAATGGTPKPTAEISVPDLQGLTPAEAQSLLRREGLEIGQIKRESAAAPLGTIINQAPVPGSQATVGNRINITVAAEVRVPDLRKLSRAEAIKRLEDASLEVGRITEENSSQPNGSVIKQWPLPGVPAAADDKVDITVAKGLLVPDLRTLGLNDARARLRQTGLQPGKVENRPSNQRTGTIIEQRPAANAPIKSGATVDVVLAAAPVVPDLTGRTLDQSKRLLADQFLSVGSVTTRVASQRQGTVLEQQPRANTDARAGTRVDLVLAEGLETPSLIGLTPDEAGAELAKQLMRLGSIERQVTSDGDNRIIQQSPTAGSPASFGVAIDVVVKIPPTVPDLLGLKEDAVTARLAEQQLTLVDMGYLLAPNLPSGTVIRQTPDPGTAITPGEAIEVVMAVSEPPADRPDLVAVPTLNNLTVAQADQSLKAAGLQLLVDGNSASDQPHRISSQSPEPGRFIKTGSQVTAFAVPMDRVIVPDLAGVDQSVIDTVLSETFLTEGERSWTLSGKPQGTVVSQDPIAGTEVDFGVPIDIVLSAASLIPDLTGLTPEEATPVLGGQSLRLGGIDEVFSFRWPGTIVAQVPPPDSPAGTDSIVRVQVVGLVGPLTAGGSLLLVLAGVVWFTTRQSGNVRPAQSVQPPPVYGIAKSAPARPAFNRTARAARPEAAAAPMPEFEPDYVIEVDTGNQVIQTDAPNLVKPSIRLRGRADPGEQRLAIESS